MRERLQRLGWEIPFLFLLVFIFDILPLGAKALLVVVAIVYALSLWFPPREKLLTAVSITIGLLLLNFVVPHFMQATYYREHEKLEKRIERGFKRYGPNQNIVIEHGHGDLVAMGFAHPEIQSIKEERRLEFRSDEFGYRDYGGKENPNVILVGDSFVVGNGNTQADNLSQLLLEKNIRSYNLGHNGDIAEYLAALANARIEIGLKNTPALLFAFEGNDFAQVNYCVQADSGVGKIRDVHRAVKEMDLARFFAAVFGRFSAKAEKPAVRIVDSAPGKAKLGFLEEYVSVAEAGSYDSACLEKGFMNASGLAGIVFIPVKARVYSFLLPEAPATLTGTSVYAQELAKISQKLGIPFLDLTVHLRAEAKKLLPNGKFVYWRDDTHWNRQGMQIAVDTILPLIKGFEKQEK